MKYFLLGILMISMLFSAKATHIVGGEIGYRCLDNNGNYEITLTVYRDCYYGEPPFDTLASIGFFIEGVDSAIYELLIPDTFSDTIVYELEDPCLSIPPDVCVEVMQYVDTIHLPLTDNGYTIVYQRCCRNETLLNIAEPTETGASFVIQMTRASMDFCNSSPVFNNWPPLALCINKMLNFDHSAADVEGDSVVYTICTPYVGAHHSNVGDPMPHPPEYPIQEEVVWIDPPYNESNMLGGVPLTIDPMSGQLTAIPNTIGQFVVGVCMSEYRGGMLLSETKRDFQFNVSDCGKVVSSFFLPAILCDELTIDFSNLSSNANSYNWDFGVSNSMMDTSSLQNPQYTYPDTGMYVITLISAKNESCVDTFVKTINLQKTTFDIGIDWDLVGCGDSLIVQVMDQTVDSVFNITSWAWELSNDVTTIYSNIQNPSFSIPAGANNILHGVITSSNGCKKEIERLFTIPFIPDLPDTLVQICTGDDVLLNPNPIDSLSYSWLPTSEFEDPSLPSQSIIKVLNNKYYSVIVNDLNSDCEREFDIRILVEPHGTILAQANPDTILLGETSLLSVTGSGPSYIWSPAETLDKADGSNPVATPTESITYMVIGKSGGCPDSTTVRVVVLNPECNLPNVFVPTGFTPNNDGLNDDFRVFGFIVETMHLMVFDRWGEKVFETSDQSIGWDGTFKGEDLPSDVYGFYVKVGCINGETYEHKGNVTLIR